MTLSLLAVSALADDTGGNATATHTSSKVLVNGKSKSFTAYTINGSNYFRLRDIAMAFNGTAKQFSVDWDGDLNEIDVNTGNAYTTVGGEMAGAGTGAGVAATPSSSSVNINGWESVIKAYTIGGSNYFRLRDLASALNFGLNWNGGTGTISIDTTVGYDSADNSMAGGPVAELAGAWSGYFFDGKWGTIYIFWNGTFEEGYGDPSNADYQKYVTGSFSLTGNTMTVIYPSLTEIYTYEVFTMDDNVALSLTAKNSSITLFKH